MSVGEEKYLIKNMPNKTIKDDIVKWPSLRKYPCKIGKGEHDFELIEKHINNWLMRNFYIYRCKTCGKIKLADKDFGVEKSKDYKETIYEKNNII